MPILVDINKKKLTIILFSLIVIVSGIIVAVFIGYRRILNTQDILIAPLNKETTLSIDRVHQTATRDGIKEWSLDAGSAQFVKAKKEALFKDLSVTFYLKDGQKVDVTADEGILKTDSNDIEAYGNVVVKSQGYRLITEKIEYEHRKRIVFSKQPVTITAEAFDLVADSMYFDLNTKKTLFKGNVGGTLREHIML